MTKVRCVCPSLILTRCIKTVKTSQNVKCRTISEHRKSKPETTVSCLAAGVNRLHAWVKQCRKGRTMTTSVLLPSNTRRHISSHQISMFHTFGKMGMGSKNLLSTVPDRPPFSTCLKMFSCPKAFRRVFQMIISHINFGIPSKLLPGSMFVSCFSNLSIFYIPTYNLKLNTWFYSFQTF